MTVRSSNFVPLVVATLLMAVPAAAQDTLDQSKRQTVKITVARSGQPVEVGSGVVLCQQRTDRGNEVFVLTAHHVFAGKSPQPSGKNALRMRRLSSVEISFFGNSPPSVGKDALMVHQVPGEDLLLLSFPVDQSVLERATLDSPAGGNEGADEDDWPAVYAVGFWKDRSESWAHRQGVLRPGGARLIHHTGEIAEGFSGGPLFNEAGSLIGINIERVRGEAIGADDRWYGEALAMDQILPAIHKWVPSVCLKSASPLSELAHLTYREAMRKVSTKRWNAAKALMAEAIEQQPLEGGSVHLEGLRYTPYLPYYHAGLASYKLAGRGGPDATELYSEAVRLWDRSEAQGVIQGNKRHKNLEKLREKSYKQLRAQRAASDAG